MYPGLGIALAVTGIAHIAVLGPPMFPVDDPYITLHTTEVVRTGHDTNE